MATPPLKGTIYMPDPLTYDFSFIRVKRDIDLFVQNWYVRHEQAKGKTGLDDYIEFYLISDRHKGENNREYMDTLQEHRPVVYLRAWIDAIEREP